MYDNNCHNMDGMEAPGANLNELGIDESMLIPVIPESNNNKNEISSYNEYCTGTAVTSNRVVEPIYKVKDLRVDLLICNTGKDVNIDLHGTKLVNYAVTNLLDKLIDTVSNKRILITELNNNIIDELEVARKSKSLIIVRGEEAKKKLEEGIKDIFSTELSSYVISNTYLIDAKASRYIKSGSSILDEFYEFRRNGKVMINERHRLVYESLINRNSKLKDCLVCGGYEGIDFVSEKTNLTNGKINILDVSEVLSYRNCTKNECMLDNLIRYLIKI